MLLEFFVVDRKNAFRDLIAQLDPMPETNGEMFARVRQVHNALVERRSLAEVGSVRFVKIRVFVARSQVCYCVTGAGALLHSRAAGRGCGPVRAGAFAETTRNGSPISAAFIG